MTSGPATRPASASLPPVPRLGALRARVSQMQEWLREIIGRDPAETLVPPGRAEAAAAGTVITTAPRPATPQGAGPAPAWSPARIAAAEALWGDGFVTPGGEEDTLRLAKPLGLTSAMTLLLLGAGSGGPARSIATSFGCWVAGFEADPQLAQLAAARVPRSGPLAKRITIEQWSPSASAFRANYYNHCLALGPLRGAPPRPLLAAVAQGLKRDGQLVLVELVAEAPLDPADPATAAWCRLEQRSPQAPSEGEVTRILGQLGFDVRVVEDISDRHGAIVMAGWRAAVASLAGRKPDRGHAAALITEAELWLVRLRLTHAKRLRLMRWHAILRV